MIAAARGTEQFPWADDSASATSVIVHRVPAQLRPSFLELQQDITREAERFAGYRRTAVYPPVDERHDEWVVVVQFDDENHLQTWLKSPQRAHWSERLTREIGNYRLQTLPGGFGAWFTDAAEGAAAERSAAPAHWKMALTVLLGLYPTVMLLTLLVCPWTASLGPAWSMLIGNALSVCILQWGVMPLLTRRLAGWLEAPADAGSRQPAWRGALCIASALAGMALLFGLAAR